jgi:hypothetical protein
MKFQYGVLRVGISRIAIEDYFVVSSSISKSAFLESFSVFHNNGIPMYFLFLWFLFTRGHKYGSEK